MKRGKAVLFIGLAWGALSLWFILFVARIKPPQLGPVLAGLEPFSAIVDTFTAHKARSFFPLFLPYAAGLDMSVWTAGLLLWLGGYGSWPGAAWGRFLSLHPVLAWVAVVAFTFLGGAALVGIPFSLWRLCVGVKRRL